MSEVIRHGQSIHTLPSETEYRQYNVYDNDIGS